MALTFRTATKRAGLSIFFFVVFVISMATTISLLVRRSDEVRVPSVVGKSLGEARFLFSSRGLSISVQGHRFSNQVPKDGVLQQSVGSEELVRPGRSISIVLSAGPRDRPVPRVVGLDTRAAEAVLRSTDFQPLALSTTCSDAQQTGTVLAQNPSPGENSTEAKVMLLVATGPCANRFIMPSYSGQFLEVARHAFEEAGFASQTIQVALREDLPDRTVLGSDPPPGSVIMLTSAIRWIVSENAALAAVSETGRLAWVTVPVPLGFFRRNVELWIDRGESAPSYAIDFLASPGENAPLTLWITSGSEITARLDGHEVWRKQF